MSLAPVGRLEKSVAERIILNEWRQWRAAARLEVEQLGMDPFDVPDGFEQSDADEILFHAQAIEEVWSTIHEFCRASDETGVYPEWAETMLFHTSKDLGLKDFESYWRQVQKPATWTVGTLRQHISTMAEQYGGKTFGEVIDLILERLAIESAEYERAAGAVEDELNAYRRRDLRRLQASRRNRQRRQLVFDLAPTMRETSVFPPPPFHAN